MNSWIAYAAIAVSGIILLAHILVIAYVFWGRKKPASPAEAKQEKR